MHFQNLHSNFCRYRYNLKFQKTFSDFKKEEDYFFNYKLKKSVMGKLFFKSCSRICTYDIACSYSFLALLMVRLLVYMTSMEKAYIAFRISGAIFFVVAFFPPIIHVLMAFIHRCKHGMDGAVANNLTVDIPL